VSNDTYTNIINLTCTRSTCVKGWGVRCHSWKRKHEWNGYPERRNHSVICRETQDVRDPETSKICTNIEFCTAFRPKIHQPYWIKYGEPHTTPSMKYSLSLVPFTQLCSSSILLYSSSPSSSAPFCNTSASSLSKSSACAALNALIRSAGPVGFVTKSAICPRPIKDATILAPTTKVRTNR
jgi:hypothetical protein